LAQGPGGPVLLAANFRAGTVDVFANSATPGGPLQMVGQFTDPNAPAGYAPFNVQNIGGTIFVTFAKQDEDKEDDVAGPGNGFIDMFNSQTHTFTRFATGSSAGGDLEEINSPWGLAVAPNTFGSHAGELLVGNFGSGTIMGFDLATGEFQGLLRKPNDRPVAIEGLWALAFGNGGRGGDPDTLYFTAGPDDETHGLFGSLSPLNHDDEGDDDDHEQDDDDQGED
jgi:uncharacterized protein (TIGR03118 family)